MSADQNHRQESKHRAQEYSLEAPDHNSQRLQKGDGSGGLLERWPMLERETRGEREQDDNQTGRGKLEREQDGMAWDWSGADWSGAERSRRKEKR